MQTIDLRGLGTCQILTLRVRKDSGATFGFGASAVVEKTGLATLDSLLRFIGERYKKFKLVYVCEKEFVLVFEGQEGAVEVANAENLLLANEHVESIGYRSPRELKKILQEN